MFWRNPASAAFTFAFPLMFLVIFAAINGNDRVDSRRHGEVRAVLRPRDRRVRRDLRRVHEPRLHHLASAASRGVLKRVRGTPLPPTSYLAGSSATPSSSSVILTVLDDHAGLIAYGVTLPHRYLGLVVTVALGAVCFSACGAAVATFIPNEDAAPGDRELRPVPAAVHLRNVRPGSRTRRSSAGIASVFPVRHLVQQLTAVFDPSVSGSGISAVHIAVLLAWGVVAPRRRRDALSLGAPEPGAARYAPTDVADGAALSLHSAKGRIALAATVGGQRDGEPRRDRRQRRAPHIGADLDASSARCNGCSPATCSRWRR